MYANADMKGAIMKLCGDVSVSRKSFWDHQRISSPRTGTANFWIVSAISFALFLMCGSTASAYTVIQLGSGVPESVEQSLIASTTAQYLGTVFVNPLVSNTYQIKILGLNPNYQAPAPPPTTLEQALSLGATVYVYGFVDGQSYERHHDLGTIQNYQVNCSSPTFFSVAVDSTSCNAILGQLANDIYTQNFSTPTVIPPPQPFLGKL